MLRKVTKLAVDGAKSDVGLSEGGYLYLASDAGAATLKANHALQLSEGADILWLEKAALHQKFPWLNLDDVTCGTWGRSGEGWFDGWALLQALRAKAKSLGVTYMKGEVASYELAGTAHDRKNGSKSGRVSGVTLQDGTLISCGVAVNAAGSHGAKLAATAGVAMPIQARKRFVYSFICKAEIGNCPLMIDMSGVYVRPEGHRTAEGQMFICGASPKPEHDTDWDENDPAVGDVDWRFFEETVWPALAARVPAFESIRPGRAWAGPYDMNLMDANAIIGPALSAPNLFLANGFSGHGLQQAPAVGRGLAELIIHGRYVTLDMTALGHQRITAGRPLIETNVI